MEWIACKVRYHFDISTKRSHSFLKAISACHKTDPLGVQDINLRRTLPEKVNDR